MPVVASILAALAVAAALVFASRLWFNRIQRRRHAEQIGIEVLNTRRWRDALDLLVKALESEGLQQTAEVTSAVGAPMPERILMRGASRILLIYKHGTTYRIGGPALLDAERRRQEAGLDEVIIATLGTVDDEGNAQAARMKIVCLDGAAVWARVQAILDATTRDGVAAEAEARVHRPRRLATVGAGVLGFAIVVWGSNLDGLALGGFVDEPVDVMASRPSDAAEAPPAAADPASTPANASASAPKAADVAASAPASASNAAPGTENAEPTVAPADPRTNLAKALTTLPEIQLASWSSGTTMVITLAPRTSIDAGVQKACELSREHPLLREVRLQVEAYGSTDVRWRRCV
jgi:hypothetical protein